MLVHFLQFILITSLFYSVSNVAADTKLKTPVAPALFVFGDSLFDSGNNNLLTTLAKANYSPYGLDFPLGVTGRFTNGKTVADFIAEYMGLPYPPPVIGLPTRDMYTGVNYASGACGILDQTGSITGKCLNMKDQVNLFNKSIETVLRRRYKNPEDLSLYLSKSIFIFSIGNNDYLGNYLTHTYDTRKRYNPQQFSKLLVQLLSQQLQRLYKLGARKVLVFELGPIGCIPSIAKTTKHSGLCNEGVNRIVSLFNDELGQVLPNLASILPGSNFVLAKVHGFGYDAVINPSKYGLTNSRDPCCIVLLNNTGTCIPGSGPCEKRNEYYFWDAYHPTEAITSNIASTCISGSTICNPNLDKFIHDF